MLGQPVLRTEGYFDEFGTLNGDLLSYHEEAGAHVPHRLLSNSTARAAVDTLSLTVSRQSRFLDSQHLSIIQWKLRLLRPPCCNSCDLRGATVDKQVSVAKTALYMQHRKFNCKLLSQQTSYIYKLRMPMVYLAIVSFRFCPTNRDPHDILFQPDSRYLTNCLWTRFSKHSSQGKYARLYCDHVTNCFVSKCVIQVVSVQTLPG